MKQLRKEDLSIHHYIRYAILTEYAETEYTVPLEYLPDISTTGSYVYQAASSMDPLPSTRGRGWAYIDAYGDITEQQNSVIVYDGSSAIISGTNYMVDYIDGRIIVASQALDPKSATYQYFYVALVNDWDTLQDSGVPIIALNIESTTKEGFQLGGGRYVTRRGRLNIFATNQAERDDLGELLYDGLREKCCPNQNWTKGSMIDWNGTFNQDYVYELIQYQSSLHFINVNYRKISPGLFDFRIPSFDMTMLSDLNRYRAIINFDIVHWEEG